MYINGVFASSASYDSPIVGPVEVRVGAYNSNQQLNGWIDDFAIIPRALTAEEVSQIYSSNAPLRVLSSAFELQLMKVNTVGVTNAIVGNGSGLFASITNATQTIASFALINDNVSSWGGFTSLKAGDVIIGDSAGQYLKFKREDGTLILKGQLIITGASGYASFTDKPTSLADINAAQNTKLTNIQAGATVGADWDSNLSDIPIRFGNAPVGGTAGLYLTPTHLGYYDGSAWKMWMSSAGQFYFGSSSGARLQWNGSTLAGYDSGGTLQWSAGSSDGLIKAGANKVLIGSDGISILAGNFSGVGYGSLTNALLLKSRFDQSVIGGIMAGEVVANENFIMFGGNSNKRTTTYLHSITTSSTNDAMFSIIARRDAVDDFQESYISMNIQRIHFKSPEIILFNGNSLNKQDIHVNNIRMDNGKFWAGTIINNYSFRNTTDTDYVGIAARNVTLSEGFLISDQSIKLYTVGGANQAIYGAQLLASSNYSHSSRLPTNGIYSLGGVSIARTAAPDVNYKLDVLGNTRLTGTLEVTGATSVGSLASSGVITGTAIAAAAGNNITTGNGFSAPKLTSTPSLADGTAMVYFKETSGATRIVFAYREGATTYYYYNNIEDMAGGWIHSTTAP
jgi:hypothetical protein